MSGVVVGIDGSPGSVAALEHAVEEASLRKGGLRAVMAWSVPALAYDAEWTADALAPQTFEDAANASLDDALGQVDASGVEVTRVVRQGQPADVLVAEAKDADVLVVGSRGRGGFRGLLLGSVSMQCAQHAGCPVTIVPHGLAAD
jgi:nucleotide-binding universal stress UspA family protein